MKVEDVFGDLPEIQTDRLVLRRITQEDAEDLFEFSSDQEVVRPLFQSPHDTLGDSKNYIKKLEHKYERNQVVPWGLVHIEERKMIGTAGFHTWLPRHGRGELAFMLSRNFWGRGLMTEALEKVIEFGFEQMNLVRIQGKCGSENESASDVFERAGFTLEGILRNYIFADGDFRDLKMYSILKRDLEPEQSGSPFQQH